GRRSELISPKTKGLESSKDVVKSSRRYWVGLTAFIWSTFLKSGSKRQSQNLLPCCGGATRNRNCRQRERSGPDCPIRSLPPFFCVLTSIVRFPRPMARG